MNIYWIQSISCCATYSELLLLILQISFSCAVSFVIHEKTTHHVIFTGNHWIVTPKRICSVTHRKNWSLSHAAPRSYVESVARSAGAGGESSTSPRSLSPLGERPIQQRSPSPSTHTLNPPLSSSSPIQTSQG